MSILERVATRATIKPRRTVIYGGHGVGKSTWAASWPKSVFVDIEDGIDHLTVPSFPPAKTLQEAWEPVMALGAGGHEFETVVVDSVDWLERMIWDATAKKAGKDHISDIGYGKGYAEAAQKLSQYLHALTVCRNAGMHVVVIAHSAITRFESPDGDSYDRFAPKLHKEACAVLQEWADEVLFATYKVFTKTQEEKFGRERSVGIGTGERVLKTTERPSHNAKNRLGLPDEMSMDFTEYSKFLTKEKNNG